MSAGSEGPALPASEGPALPAFPPALVLGVPHTAAPENAGDGTGSPDGDCSVVIALPTLVPCSMPASAAAAATSASTAATSTSATCPPGLASADDEHTPLPARHPSTATRSNARSSSGMTSTNSSGRRGAASSAAAAAVGTTMRCEPCRRQFYSARTYESHMLCHQGNRPFPCDQCDKAFNSRANLSRHRRLHSEERPYACQVCAKTFKDPANLNHHTRLHRPELMYKCGACDRTFADRGNLSRHAHTHNDERPFACDLCRCRYGSAQALASHRRVHAGDGEAALACTECDRTFGDRTSLARHRRTHTHTGGGGGDRRPCTCPECGKRFRDNADLAAHLATHAPRRRGARRAAAARGCAHCGSQFASEAQLSAHLAEVHGDDAAAAEALLDGSSGEGSTPGSDTQAAVQRDTVTIAPLAVDQGVGTASRPTPALAAMSAYGGHDDDDDDDDDDNDDDYDGRVIATTNNVHSGMVRRIRHPYSAAMQSEAETPACSSGKDAGPADQSALGRPWMGDEAAQLDSTALAGDASCSAEMPSSIHGNSPAIRYTSPLDSTLTLQVEVS